MSDVLSYTADGRALTRMTPGSAGYDLTTTRGGWVWPLSTRWFPTGLSMAIPEGHAGLVLPRSGLAARRRLAPANSPGLIDSDYRGEVIVVLENRGLAPRYVKAGERIAQLVFIKNAELTPLLVGAEGVSLTETSRGAGGFGHTGR